MTLYATFYCKPCRDEPSDTCGDSCGLEVVEPLPPIWLTVSEGRPACQCCGGELSIGDLLEPASAG